MAKHDGSKFPVVKIAIAVVLGLLIIKACDRYDHKQASSELGKFVDSVQTSAPAQTRAQREGESEQREQGRKLEHEPLQDDERCVEGERFRRAADGWVRNGSC